MHQDLVAHGVGIERDARVWVGNGRQAGQQVRLDAGRAGVDPPLDERVGSREKELVLPVVAPAPGPDGFAGQEREIGTRIGDPTDALLRALGHRRGERRLVRVRVEDAEVVVAGAAARDLERVALHPFAQLERLVVGDRGPGVEHLTGDRLHPFELRLLVRGCVPGKHHSPNAVVVVAVRHDRDAAAARSPELVEEVDLLDPLAELLLVAGDLVQEDGVGDHDDPPLLGGNTDGVDVTEAPPELELLVVVVDHAVVGVALPVRDEPADRVGDLEQLARLRARRGHLRELGSAHVVGPLGAGLESPDPKRLGEVPCLVGVAGAVERRRRVLAVLLDEHLGTAGMVVHPLADVVDASCDDDPEVLGGVVPEDLVPLDLPVGEGVGVPLVGCIAVERSHFWSGLHGSGPERGLEVRGDGGSWDISRRSTRSQPSDLE